MKVNTSVAPKINMPQAVSETQAPPSQLFSPAPHYEYEQSAPASAPEQEPLAYQSPAERLAASPDYLYLLCKEKVSNTAYYQELRQNPNINPNKAYVKGADALVNDRDAQLEPFEREMISLSARLGSFIHAGIKLDDLRYGGRLTSEELTIMTQIKLKEIIPFNHAIKDLINRFPEVNATDLADNLTAADAKIFSRYNPAHPGSPNNHHEASKSSIAYEFTATINGMRHEAAAEKLLIAADIDYDYRVSVEEDSQGNDLFVFIDGDWVGIDIKASYNAEARAYQRHRNSRAVWTTLDNDDFRGPNDDTHDSVSISYETSQEHALAFGKRVHEAVAGDLREEHYQARRRAKRHGRGAITAARHF